MVLPDPTGQAQLRAWYTQGWDNTSIGTATSNDGGLTWTRYAGNPIIGQGMAGVANTAAHTGMCKEPNGTLHIFFGTTEATIYPFRAVSSTDGGLTWGNVRTVLTHAGWEAGQWGNSSCVIKDGVWHLLYESLDSASSWQVGYATSLDGLTWTRQNGGQPLTTLRTGTGMYGGVDLHARDDGTWELFFHANNSGTLPTDIFRATSSDLINWERRPGYSIVKRSLSFEYDQTADPAVIDINGQRVMFYSGVNNPTETSKIGRAVYVPA